MKTPRHRRDVRSIMAALLAATLVSVGLATPSAATEGQHATDSGAEPPAPTMGDYRASDFRAEASELDVELQVAIVRDLDISPEEYLAQAQAASDASDVVERLFDDGVDASDRRLEGTELLIGVEDDSDAELVRAAGAVPVLGGLDESKVDYDKVRFESTADIYGGDMIVWSSSTGAQSRCSVGFNGTNDQFESQFVTAGHCTSSSLGNGGLYRHFEISAPGFTPGPSNAPQSAVGVPRSGSFAVGDGYDAGLIRVTQPGFTAPPLVSRYGGALGPRSSSLLTVRDTIIPTSGAVVCKSGATSGWTCGTVLESIVVNLEVTRPAPQTNYLVDGIMTNVCMLPGDSGGAAMVGSAAIGVNSASAFGSPGSGGYSGTPHQFCAAAANKLSVMVPLRHDPGIRTVSTLYGSSWEPTVHVEIPKVTLPGIYTSGQSMVVSGTIGQPNPRTRIRVTVNGAVFTVVPNSTHGTWSVNVGSVSGSVSTVGVEGRWGSRSSSIAMEYQAQSGGAWAPITVERIAGQDRYDVAIAIAQRAYPSPSSASTVYVVNGADYPDALSAGSAAAATGGVIMLVPSSTLLPKVRAELVRLSPQKIVIVGGPASVSEAVKDAMAAAVPGANVSRISGADRFVVSRAVLQQTAEFQTAQNIYIANGYNYPDALVAGAAGSSSSNKSPVLLVPGIFPTVPAATLTTIDSFSFSTIKIAGGEASVTPGIQTQLSSLLGSQTTRLGGSDRFEAARSVANDAYPATATTVFLTTGLNFPDALAGAPLAGLLNAPMYSVRTTCVPQSVLFDLARLKPSSIILLGGTGTLTPSVQSLTPCS